MKVLRTVTVKLSDLKVNLFVRKSLDQDHVLHLAELIEAGVEMNTLIQVTEDMNVIDGRHRKEAYDLAKKTEVRVQVLRMDDESELIGYAYRANTGVSKLPTSADTDHTIMLLLEKGESMKRIGELLGLPTSVARKYAMEVKSRMARAKLQRAVDAVTEGGLTTVKAAEQYGVDLDKLKESLSGRRKKGKKGVAEILANLGRNQRSHSQKVANALRSLQDKYEDGDVVERQVRQILQHIEEGNARSARSLTEWKKRFDAITNKSASLKKSA
ncbi:MAG: ParB N-terminal domain-containing protein [Patescibacteria group bacterium]